jgi:predicted negative regulator of RcsB-dependent stress response
MAERGKWEWNINTVAQIVGFLIIFATIISAWRDTQNQVGDINAWRISHEEGVKTLVAQEAAALSALTARIDSLAVANATASTAADRLGYRVAGLEAKSPQVDEALKELSRTLAEQSGDLKVIREILQRIEKGQRGPPN